ncbi:MAG: DUF2214 family protein [Candidatus Eremiobacteraeota bacterium]|nr:DUF2214 family protein [Candidatus Eremiobacteraeota bacterium]
MLDLGLAIAHHLAIFALLGILAAEAILLARGLDRESVIRLARVDAWYGALAALVLVVGFSRAIFAAKGWAYYSHNSFFWAKMISFALLGVLSIPPTLQYIAWSRSNEVPDVAKIRRVRYFLYGELALFALLPIFAAAMARGYGEYQ